MYDGVSVRQDFSGGGKILWWDVARLSQGPQRAPTVRSDGNPSDGSVFQADPKPSLRGQLKGPANKVSDDIGVTDDEFEGVLVLLPVGTVEILPEGRFNTGSVDVVRPLGLHAARLGRVGRTLSEYGVVRKNQEAVG